MHIEEITASTAEANELVERAETGGEGVSVEELAEAARRLGAAMNEVCASAEQLGERLIEIFRDCLLFPLVASPWELHMIQHAKSARLRKKYRDRVLRRWNAENKEEVKK